MGAVFKLPVAQVTSLEKAIKYLRDCGVKCIAAHPHAEQKKVSEVDFRRNVCVVVGSEGTGLSSAVLEACDEHAVIPMQNQVDSLNVGDAGAVFLYEAARQRVKA